MKNYIVISAILITFSSCAPSITVVGNLNMISNRNVIPDMKYAQISAYHGATKKDIKKSRHTKIEDAIDATVRQVPNGEFLTNVKIYLVDGEYFVVEGDVWGRAGDNVVESMKGFKVGDRVQINGVGKKQGTIISIVDATYCLVQEDGETSGRKLEYSKVIKIDAPIEKEVPTQNTTITTTTTITPPMIQTTASPISAFTVGQIVDFDHVTEGWMEGKISYIAPDNKISVDYTTKQGLIKTVKVAPTKVKAKQ